MTAVQTIPKSLREKLGDDGAEALIHFATTYIREKMKDSSRVVAVPELLLEKLGDDGIEGLVTMLDAMIKEKGIISN